MTLSIRVGGRIAALLAVPILAVGAIACSSSSTTGSSTGTSQPGTTASPATTTPAGNGDSTSLFDKEVQKGLQVVGCYNGAIDGVLGPQTDAAIVAFQQASGLETDGEYGPETDQALRQDVTSLKKVCGGTTTTTGSAGSSSTSSSTTTPAGPPCTATALLAALGGKATITGYVCSGTYAAATETGYAQNNPPVIFRASGTSWQVLDSANICGAASAGYPPIILQVGCASGASSTTVTTAGPTTTT